MRASGVALLALAFACGGKKSSAPPSDGSGSAAAIDPPNFRTNDLPEGLVLRLSHGKQGPPAFDRAKLAPATKLPDAEVAALLAKAPPITTDPTDAQAFALRPASTPPPVTGETIKTAFPPAPGSDAPPPASLAGKPLAVTRFRPDGETQEAPSLSVTFSHPMVAVTSQTAAAQTVPVKLAPTPKGKWRWIGTRTIVFDAEPRFPHATTYRVEVPAGTKSATGEALAKPVAFTFETPAPRIVEHYPHQRDNQRTDTPILIVFDQKVDPAAMLGALRVNAFARVRPEGEEPWGTTAVPVKMRLVDAKEIAAHQDERFTAAVGALDAAQAGRWIAIRAMQALPVDSKIVVELPVGAPSAEGPNKTKKAASFWFPTYPALAISRTNCDREPCPAGSTLDIEFTTELDDAFDPKLVTVTPAIPDATITSQGDSIWIQGPTVAQTKYTVTISKDLADAFGQTLGKDATRTIAVGDARETFVGPNGLVVLDPALASPALEVFTTNHPELKVKLYRVSPADFPAYEAFYRERWRRTTDPGKARAPGKLVSDLIVKTTAGANQLVATRVELAAALGGTRGHVVAVIEPHPWDPAKHRRRAAPRAISWVQVTKLAVDAHVDPETLVGFASDLATGAPVGGVELELRPAGKKITTDAQGLATLPLPAGNEVDAFVVARHGEDVTILDGDDWRRQARDRELVWYVSDDRGMYRPGETVSLKGWLRARDHGKGGDLALPAIQRLTYIASDAQNVKVGTGTVPVDALGGFDLKLVLPKTPNLGHANIELHAPGVGYDREYDHGFQIQEFRRPEFEVSAVASPGPYTVGGSADITVSAKYYAGGPLPGARTTWNVFASETTFTPPNQSGYAFGSFGQYTRMRSITSPPRPGPVARPGRLEARTDGSGSHTVHVDFVSVKPQVPMSVVAMAEVEDVNRQEWSARATMLVHPASLYVGLKPLKPFVTKGTPIEVSVIGVDLDGKTVAGAKIDVQAARLEWKLDRGEYTEREVDPQACKVVAQTAPAPCKFQTPVGGRYLITATITDDKGRKNQSQSFVWVSGGEPRRVRTIEREEIEVVPDKAEYAPGTTAELLVATPFYPAEGIVTWRRNGIIKTERITMTGPTTIVKVPITDAMVPGLTVQVDLAGAATRLDAAGHPDPKQPKRPAYAVGSAALEIPPVQRKLTITATPAASKLAPREHTSIAIAIADAAGKPVAGAQAAVFVVDEAILALSDHAFDDPLDAFYEELASRATSHYVRSALHLATLADAKQAAAGGGSIPSRRYGTIGHGSGTGSGYGVGSGRGGMRRGESALGAIDEANEMPDPDKVGFDFRKKVKVGADPVITVRSDFTPLAAFSPVVTTGPDGKAVAEVTMPDNLTRYRVVVLAVAGDRQFGKGESTITARLPLMIRPSAPRFLNFGDTFKLPVVVQNQTDAPMTVKLAARTANLALTDGAGRSVTVPANDRVEVQFPAAAGLAGTARFQIVGTAGAASDATEIALPVWTPATTEAFATYGTLDDGAIAQPVALPGKVVLQYGGLEVTTASTNLQALTDALLYLVRYPFECAEQRSSRVLAIASLRDVLVAFHAKDLPSQAQLASSVGRDLEQLGKLQDGSGGFHWWSIGNKADPYLTAYVTHALVRAKAKGYAVPAELLARAKQYLRNIANVLDEYDSTVALAIEAYALSVRKQLGDPDVARARELVAKVGGADKLPLEVAGWLLGAFGKSPAAVAERTAIVRHAMNRVTETAGAASFQSGLTTGAHHVLASDRRVDAVLLDALIDEQPRHELVPKLVTGLLAHRKRGRWLSTHENAFVLIALEKYFRTYEKVTPSFVAKVWLGSDFAGEQAFRGRSTTSQKIAIPMTDVAGHDRSNLTIAKTGPGRLYYRIGMSYAPASLVSEAADHGFVVERRYEAVDDPKDVTRGQDGTWRIKAGARVRVRLVMVTEGPRYHVALVDPLPAGFEAMNPALAITGAIPDAPDGKPEPRKRWWYGPWYEHQNLRDERVEVFAAEVEQGVHNYDYVARATTPGTYIVPPAKAEEMYMPETFGRAASDRVVVE